ncbi:hypothetical protein [Litoribacillus peritrichatus]|uniref:Uncharacterized protein n=1 Tax=Litoribacillus peritrichatus TaxID=718191 RepID=A0ABP7MWW5_9GAMM
MNNLETLILINVIGFVILLTVTFIAGWWFLKKQANIVSREAVKSAQQEIKKAKQQLIKMNKQMLSQMNKESNEVDLEYSPVVIDGKSIRAVEEIYKAFVVWGKNSADGSTRIIKIGAQALAGMHSVKQEEHVKRFYDDTRKLLKMATQLEHQIQFDAAYLDEELIQDMEKMAAQAVSLSENLLDSVKRAADQVKSTAARENLKIYTSMERVAQSIVNFHQVEYKNFVKQNLAKKVRDLRTGMSLASEEMEE